MPISINNTTLTFNNGTTMTTAATGTVSSVATGNGLQGGTITTTGTLSVACPTYNTVGSYALAGDTGGTPLVANVGGNLAGSTIVIRNALAGPGGTNTPSGTWKFLGYGQGIPCISFGGYLVCRVS
jgi:hypothetical protein